MKLWKEKRTWIAKNAKEKLNKINKNDVKKIGVIKHAAFGDLLLTRPFLITLHEYFASASITFSAISHYQKGIPDDLIDELHVMPSKEERKGFRDTVANIKKFGEHDLIFDLTASTISFYISKLNRAKFKIGFQHHSLHKYIYDAAILRAEYRFEAETFLEQLHILGIQYELPLKFNLNVTADKNVIPNVVIFPTASNKEKSWDRNKFILLFERLLSRFNNFDFILLEGMADWEKKIANEIKNKLSGFRNFKYYSADVDIFKVIKSSMLLISNDTGIRHAGIALEVPTIGIFFDTPPFGYWPRFGNHNVVFNTEGGEPEVGDVFNAALQFLDSKK